MADLDEAYERLLLIGESIRNQIKALSNLTISIGVGTPVKGFESVPRSFHEAEIALLYRLVEGGDKVLTYGKTKEDSFTSGGMKKWSWEALEEAINRGRVAEVDKQVELVVTELCRTAQTPEMVHQQICKLLLHYYEVSEDLGLSKDWIGHKDIRSLLNGICSISSPEELIEECKLLLGKLTSDIAAGHKQHDRDPVAQALRYLERHYREPIALKEVADKVFLNPAYFSTLFKQKTGKTFIERLTEIRIEEAKKKLVSSDSKMTDIAEQTGFSNIRHFNRVFKNETGLTPKDYRERA
jgi:two-component system response regulator YesN